MASSPDTYHEDLLDNPYNDEDSARHVDDSGSSKFILQCRGLVSKTGEETFVGSNQDDDDGVSENGLLGDVEDVVQEPHNQVTKTEELSCQTNISFIVHEPEGGNVNNVKDICTDVTDSSHADLQSNDSQKTIHETARDSSTNEDEYQMLINIGLNDCAYIQRCNHLEEKSNVDSNLKQAACGVDCPNAHTNNDTLIESNDNFSTSMSANHSSKLITNGTNTETLSEQSTDTGSEALPTEGISGSEGTENDSPAKQVMCQIGHKDCTNEQSMEAYTGTDSEDLGVKVNTDSDGTEDNSPTEQVMYEIGAVHCTDERSIQACTDSEDHGVNVVNTDSESTAESIGAILVMGELSPEDCADELSMEANTDSEDLCMDVNTDTDSADKVGDIPIQQTLDENLFPIVTASGTGSVSVKCIPNSNGSENLAVQESQTDLDTEENVSFEQTPEESCSNIILNKLIASIVNSENLSAQTYTDTLDKNTSELSMQTVSSELCSKHRGSENLSAEPVIDDDGHQEINTDHDELDLVIGDEPEASYANGELHDETGQDVIEDLKSIRDHLSNMCSYTGVNNSTSGETIQQVYSATESVHGDELSNVKLVDQTVVSANDDCGQNRRAGSVVCEASDCGAKLEVGLHASGKETNIETNMERDSEALIKCDEDRKKGTSSLLDSPKEEIGLDQLFRETEGTKTAGSKSRRSKSALKRKLQQQRLQKLMAKSAPVSGTRKKYALSFHELSRPLFMDADQDVDPSLCCSVCLEMFHLPTRCHPCSHMFCDPCLRHLTHPGSEGVHCPLCRTVIQTCELDNELDERLMCTYPEVYTKRAVSERNNKHRFNRLPYTPPVPLGKKLLRKLAASRIYQSEARWMSHDWVKFLLGCMAGVFVSLMLMMFNRVRSISDARDVNIMFLSLLIGVGLTFVIFKVVKI